MKNKYYRMKVNNGNSYYPFFRDGDCGGLWIDWNKEQCENAHAPESDKKKKANKSELLGILDCLKDVSEAHKRIIFIWDREKQEICFWEIIGSELQALSPEWAIKFPSNVKAYKDQTVRDHIMDGQIIPAKKLANIPRSSFPAFIDSLSVYLYLNIGTFRSLANVRQLERKTLHLFDDVLSVESEFSSLVAKYFDWVLEPNTASSFSEYLSLSSEKVQNLVLNYMSPAQLETFGSLLLMDLGFTLEIGIGKSQDDFDLRGTFRHKENKADIIKSIEKKLEGCLKVKLSEGIKKTLHETGTVFVQCKNYSAKSCNDRILFFSQLNGDAGENVINLNNFTDGDIDLKDNFPMVWDWLQQATHFFDIPRAKLPRR